MVSSLSMLNPSSARAIVSASRIYAGDGPYSEYSRGFGWSNERLDLGSTLTEEVICKLWQSMAFEISGGDSSEIGEHWSASNKSKFHKESGSAHGSRLRWEDLTCSCESMGENLFDNFCADEAVIFLAFMGFQIVEVLPLLGRRSMPMFVWCTKFKRNSSATKRPFKRWSTEGINTVCFQTDAGSAWM